MISLYYGGNAFPHYNKQISLIFYLSTLFSYFNFFYPSNIYIQSKHDFSEGGLKEWSSACVRQGMWWRAWLMLIWANMSMEEAGLLCVQMRLKVARKIA